MIDPEDAVRLAEQAALGGLILAPRHLDTVRRWLRPADFTDPWHARVYDTLCERHSAGETITPVTIGTDLQDRLGRQHANADGCTTSFKRPPRTPFRASTPGWSSRPVCAGRWPAWVCCCAPAPCRTR